MALSLTNQLQHRNMKTCEWCRLSLHQLLLLCNYAWPFKATLDIVEANEDVKWADWEQNVQGGFNVPFSLLECNQDKLSNNWGIFFSTFKNIWHFQPSRPLVRSLNFMLPVSVWRRLSGFSPEIRLVLLTSSSLILSSPPSPLLPLALSPVFSLLLTRWFSTGGLSRTVQLFFLLRFSLWATFIPEHLSLVDKISLSFYWIHFWK